jgi:hypothetical protein
MQVEDLVRKTSPPTLDEIVSCVFGNYPLRPCSLNLRLQGSSSEVNKVLLNIMFLGARKLFGPNVSPTTITEKQFHTLNDYFHGISYTIKYRPNVNHNNETVGYNVWFEPFLPPTKCNKTRAFL